MGARLTFNRSEAAEQRMGLQLLALLGWRTWRCGQRDARGTQDPGVPDVVAIHAVYGLLFWEAKRPKGGRQSDAQREFEQACAATGIRYVCGPVEMLRQVLMDTPAAAGSRTEER